MIVDKIVLREADVSCFEIWGQEKVVVERTHGSGHDMIGAMIAINKSLYINLKHTRLSWYCSESSCQHDTNAA
jgi:hypothetical protein